MEGLLTLLLSDKLNLSVTGESSKVKSDDADRLRNEIRQSLNQKTETPAAGDIPPAVQA